MKRKFLLCVANENYEASLEVRKVNENLPDKEAERHNQLRVIDESGGKPDSEREVLTHHA